MIAEQVKFDRTQVSELERLFEKEGLK